VSWEKAKSGRTRVLDHWCHFSPFSGKGPKQNVHEDLLWGPVQPDTKMLTTAKNRARRDYGTGEGDLVVRKEKEANASQSPGNTLLSQETPRGRTNGPTPPEDDEK